MPWAPSSCLCSPAPVLRPRPETPTAGIPPSLPVVPKDDIPKPQPLSQQDFELVQPHLMIYVFECIL